MAFALSLLRVIGGVLFFGCSAPLPPAPRPAPKDHSFALALEARPCVAGWNTVSAAAFVGHEGNVLRYVTPADGELEVRLLESDGSSRPVELRWLAVDHQNAKPALSNLPWNLQLRFESSRAGTCPVRIEFRPAASAAAELGPALTTVVLQAPPPPPGAAAPP
jgi:hypothetical protein